VTNTNNLTASKHVTIRCIIWSQWSKGCFIVHFTFQ